MGSFDVTMGSFDGAEVCELVGLYVLNSLVKRFEKENIGLYRDDGLALIKGTSGRVADKVRKDLCAQFLEFGLKITAEVNHQLVNFFDMTLNLREGSYRPHRKPNNDPLYINRHSNHPPSITKQLPASISKRISSISSDKSAFDSPTKRHFIKVTIMSSLIIHLKLPRQTVRRETAEGTLSGSIRLLVRMYDQISPATFYDLLINTSRKQTIFIRYLIEILSKSVTVA